MGLPAGSDPSRGPRRRRLQSLIRAFGLVSSVPVIALAVILLMFSLGHRSQELEEQGRDVAHDVAAGLSSYYEENRRVLALLAQSSSISRQAIESGSLAAFYDRLGRAQSLSRSDFTFRDEGGKVLISTQVLRGQEGLPDTLPRESLERARQRGFALSAGHPNEHGVPALVSAVVPVVQGGDTLGYLSLDQRHGEQLVLQRETIPKGWAVAILDENYTITAYSVDPDYFIGRNVREILRPDEVAALHSRSSYSSASVMVTPMEALGRFVVVLGPAEAMVARAARYWWSLIGFSVLALLASILLGHLLSKRLTDPLRTLADEARQMQFRQVSRAEPVPIAEIGDLRGAFVASAEQLKEQSRISQQATTRLLAALDAGEIGTWERDVEKGLVKWDRRTCEIFGRSVPDTWRPLREFEALLHPDDLERVRSGMEDQSATARRGEQRFRIYRHGEIRWIHSYRIPLAGISEGRRIAGLARDITDEMREKERIATANIELELKVAERTAALERSMREQADLHASLVQAQKLEALGKFGAGAAHNFGNVLTVVQGSLEYLADRDLAPDARLRVRRALKSVGVGQRLVDRLQSFARQSRPSPVRLCLSQEIEDLLEFARESIDPRVEVEFAPGRALWDTMLDRSDVENMMMNLIINANDAMPNGGRIRIETRNESRSTLGSEPRDFVRLDVIDDGMGMSAEVAQRAVEAFFTTKPRDRGTGLGLSTVHNFIVSAGGSLEIDSTPGKGSRITVRFPRCPEDGTAKQPVVDRRDARTSGLHILVVEDEDDVRASIVDQLQRLGHRTIQALSGQQAIDLLARGGDPVSVVVSDIRMPGYIDGTGLAAWLHHNRPETAVVLLSAYRLTGPAPGRGVALQKPASDSDLSEAIWQARRAVSDGAGEAGIVSSASKSFA